MHGRDPTESVITHVRSAYAVDTTDFKEDLLFDLSAAWKLAKEKIENAQKKQYDRSIPRRCLLRLETE